MLWRLLMTRFSIPRLLSLILPLSLPFPLPAQAQNPLAPKEQALAAGECQQGLELYKTRLNLEINPQTGQLQGTFSAELQNPYSKPITQSCLVLNAGLEIKSLSLPGLKQILKEPAQADTPVAYRLIANKPLAPGARQKLSLSYTGKIQGPPKFGRIQPEDVFLTAQSFFYPRFEKAWKRYCELDVQVTLPKGYLPVLSGALEPPRLNQGVYLAPLDTNCGFQSDHGFDLAAAPFQTHDQGAVRIYYRQNKSLSPAELQTLHQEFSATLEALNKQFGSHAATQFNLVENKREDLGGMAKVNTIFLSDKYFGKPATVAPNQYSYFKQVLKDESRVASEFDYYRRTVIAHEGAHLFVNYFFDYDKPWVAEGLPEFVSLGVLASQGNKTDLERKLAEYRRIWQQIPNRPLPALNQATLDTQIGSLSNYNGTPLALWNIWQARGDGFWPLWQSWLADHKKPLLYQSFKAHFQLSPSESAQFETGFDPTGL